MGQKCLMPGGEMIKEIPTFYAIVPANVRYNDKLSDAEKIFYAELNALTNAYGYCNARNRYFCDLFGVDRRTIARWLGKLSELGFIKLTYENGERRVYLQFNSLLQNVDNSIGTDIYLGLDGTKMSHPWDKNVPVDFINNISNKIDLLNKNISNIFTDDSNRQKLEDLVKEIHERMHSKYPGYSVSGQLKSKAGIMMNLIVLTLCKAYFDPELVGIRLSGKYIHHSDIVDLIDVFDVANCHALANYLVEKNCEVKNLKMYIMASLFNAHEKELKKIKAERKRKEEETAYLVERDLKAEKQLALKNNLYGQATQQKKKVLNREDLKLIDGLGRQIKDKHGGGS